MVVNLATYTRKLRTCEAGTKPKRINPEYEKFNIKYRSLLIMTNTELQVFTLEL